VDQTQQLDRPGEGADGPGASGAHRGDALVADGVHLSFPGEGTEDVLALDGIDLTIERGQFVALVGASGCGKTSLLNLFAGHYKPTTGSVRVLDGTPRTGHPDVGYMLARDGLLPWRTTRRNVELGLEVRGVGRRTRRTRAEELLETVGLGGFGRTYPRRLSHGMRQRAALARTLAPNPDILLMDEPYAALDAHTKLRLQAQLLDIWESEGDERQTVLFVTHDLQEALLLADRVIAMLPRPGRIAEDRVTELPRPRAHRLGEIMFTPEFRDMHERLFNVLEGS
jgi:NitT/TauT family transport system ATP-binding protein